MRITNDIILGEDVKLEDIYNMAEAVKGEKLTMIEKLIIAGVVSRDHHTYKEL